MNFKLWLEIVELRKPSGKVVKRSVIKDSGTNVVKKIIQYQYKTKLGNDVKLKFEPMGMEAYNVSFYVNDTLYDYAPRLDSQNNPEKSGRDSEILPSVFFLIRDKADKLKAKYLGFSAHASEGDKKVIRNLDVEPYKQEVLKYLDDFVIWLEKYPVKMVEPSDVVMAVNKKLNRPAPMARPNVDKEQWFSFVKEVRSAISDNKNIEKYIDRLLSTQLPINVNALAKAMRDFSNAQESNTERGWERNENRRAKVFEKIVRRYFSDKWSVEIRGNSFVLSRKS